MHTQLSPQPSKQKSFTNPLNYTKLSLYFLTTSVTILILLQIQAVKLLLPFSQYSSPSWSSTIPHWHQQPAEPAPTFTPLKDLSLAYTAMDGNTWFMGSLNDTQVSGEPKHLLFPSKELGNKILCLKGNDTSNGTMNYYALVRPDTLPAGARLIPDLTFVSDMYYDYGNLFHGLTAIVPFVAWHEMNECAMPKRWVLYHRGEVRKSMSPWAASVLAAVFGTNTKIEGTEHGSTRPRCFERAVVSRHSEGSMARERKAEVYGMMRCKARAYCNVSREVGDGDHKDVRLTLLLRTGARSFKDEVAVVRIFDKECKKVEGCRLKVVRPNNLTFCDQVELMSSTDILASPHGAQMTNLFLMDKNSSIMEFFPKGWLELAGPGQYVFHWVAASSGMRHKGAWHDSNGEDCPDSSNSDKCFSFYKSGQIGYDEEHFGKWASEVIKEMDEYKLSDEYRRRKQQELSNSCTCS